MKNSIAPAARTALSPAASTSRCGGRAPSTLPLAAPVLREFPSSPALFEDIAEHTSQPEGLAA